MTFHEWLNQVRALKALYEEALAPPPESEGDSPDPLDRVLDVRRSKKRAWAPLEGEGQALLDELHANRGEWEADLAEPSFLFSEFLDENIPTPMQEDFVKALVAAPWHTQRLPDLFSSLSDWMLAVREIPRAARPGGDVAMMDCKPDFLDEALEAKQEEWREELISLAAQLDRESIDQMHSRDAWALLNAIAAVAPVGKVPLRFVDCALGFALAWKPDAEAARPFFVHLPLDEFDWDDASIDSAWWEFLDWCKCPKNCYVLRWPSKLSVVGDVLGPAKWAVYYSASDGASAIGELYLDIYEGVMPDWLADLAAHLLEIGRPEEAWWLAQRVTDAMDVLGGTGPDMEPVQEEAQRELRRRRLSGVDMAQAYVEEHLGESFGRVSNKTRECLISAAIAVHRPGHLPGSAASELWLALETEWKYQVRLFRKLKAADYHEDLGVLDWVKEITDGPKTRLVWDFVNSRPGKALQDGHTGAILRRLRDLRNAHEHDPESVDQEELRTVMKAFWEDGVLREYIECLLPSSRG